MFKILLGPKMLYESDTGLSPDNLNQKTESSC